MPLTAAKKLILFGRQVPVTYLLGPFRFTVDQVAPLTTPYTEPGAVGALNILDSLSKLSKSGQRAQIAGNAVSDTDPSAISTVSFTRVIGRTALGLVNLNNTANRTRVGWSLAGNVSPNVHGLRLADGSFRTVTAIIGLDGFLASTDYRWACVLRTNGAFIFVKGGSFAEWTLLWIEEAGSVTPLFAGFGASDSNTSSENDTLRVADLRAPWDTDYGIATQRLAGARANGDSFTHEANCHIEFIATTLPTGSSESGIYFRKLDALNGWYAQISAGGTLALYEVVAGVYTSRGTAGAVVSAGDRVVIIAEGTTIKGYSNKVLRWTYSSAANFAALTSGSVFLNGVSAVSDIISWPRVLSGAALAELNRV